MTKEGIMPFPNNDIKDPFEAADEWLIYLYSGQTTEEGKQAFSAWLSASEANVNAYQAAEQIWQDLGFVSLSSEHLAQPTESTQPKDPLTETNMTSTITDKSASRANKWIWALAASIALVLSSAMLLFHSNNITETQYVSTIAEVKNIVLEDHSKVVLSADSKLIVSFSDDVRDLRLVRGRAYFEVQPDANRPFVVSAGNTKATAVGTAFDVNSNTEGVTVAVTHGIVDVKSYVDINNDIYSAKILVNAGQLTHSKKNGEITAPLTFDPVNELSWRTGRLIYQGQKLSVVVSEINRYRSKKIYLLDQALKEKRITLSVPADKTEQLISAIKATESVYVTDTPTEILIGKVDNNSSLN